jgi:hypothetical protein
VPAAAEHHVSVPAPADRPALAASAHATPEATGDTPPPGVATLRLHRAPDDSAESEDLPRRVRQASLAPQLRGQPAEEPARTTAPPGDERTPELVRDRMAAYRDGWARGGGRQPGRGAAPEDEAGNDGNEGDPS